VISAKNVFMNSGGGGSDAFEVSPRRSPNKLDRSMSCCDIFSSSSSSSSYCYFSLFLLPPLSSALLSYVAFCLYLIRVADLRYPATELLMTMMLMLMRLDSHHHFSVHQQLDLRK